MVGTTLAMGTIYFSQTDSKIEHLHLATENMLRACTLDFVGSWEDQLPLVDFDYNNSYRSSINMAPFEALYSRLCRPPSYWAGLGDSAIWDHV